MVHILFLLDDAVLDCQLCEDRYLVCFVHHSIPIACHRVVLFKYSKYPNGGTNIFLNPHLRICLLILEGEKGRERKTLMWERNFDRLPPICDLTGAGIHSLGVCPDQELNPQPFWCTREHSNQMSHLLRVKELILYLGLHWALELWIEDIQKHQIYFSIPLCRWEFNSHYWFSCL